MSGTIDLYRHKGYWKARARGMLGEQFVKFTGRPWIMLWHRASVEAAKVLLEVRALYPDAHVRVTD
jgi:hypothetical protein